MCWLVFFAKDPTPFYSGNIRKDVKRYRRGDCIEVLPDDHEFGTDEVGSARFRMVKLTGVPVADLVALKGPDIEDPQRTTLPRRRVLNVDLDQIEAWAETRLGRALAPGEAIVVGAAQAATVKQRVTDNRYLYADVTALDGTEKLAERTRV